MPLSSSLAGCLRLGAPTITGETPLRERQEAVDRFQADPACRVIVVSIHAGSAGKLHAASDAAFVELDWTPARLDQAEGRLHRRGQENPVTAWYLVGEDTVDEYMMRLVEKKRAVVGRATEGAEGEEVRGGIVHADDERMATMDIVRELAVEGASSGRSTTQDGVRKGSSASPALWYSTPVYPRFARRHRRSRGTTGPKPEPPELKGGGPREVLHLG